METIVSIQGCLASSDPDETDVGTRIPDASDHHLSYYGVIDIALVDAYVYKEAPPG